MSPAPLDGILFVGVLRLPYIHVGSPGEVIDFMIASAVLLVVPRQTPVRFMVGHVDHALSPEFDAERDRQSGVVQLSFAFGRPVIATRVGGLPASVEDGRDGLLCEPDDPVALARAIERMACERAILAAGVRAREEESSFRRYSELLDAALVGVRS